MNCHSRCGLFVISGITLIWNKKISPTDHTLRCRCVWGASTLFIYLLTPWSRFLLEKLTGLQLVKKFLHFMKPEGSLLQSQVPTTCPYRDPAQSSPYHHILLLEDQY
jgi:hypothetical protein